jgi:low affinity Fe/Cu permease
MTRPEHDPDSRPTIALMPSDVSSRIGVFDRFAGLMATLASRAPFFIFCIALVIAWLIEGIAKVASGGGLKAFEDSTYQLQINTTTTIVTFLLVALLQNSQTRSDQATQHKLNAIADGLADFMEQMARVHDNNKLRQDLVELRDAVGLENRENTRRS